MNSALWLAQLACTLLMTGLIWTIQWVHYPLFDGVGEAGFVRYEQRHSLRITPIVLPLMSVELLASLALVWQRPAWFPVWMALLGAGLTVLIWASTFFLQVPAHARLEQGFDARTHRWLVRSNWLRTLAWTARSGLLLACLGPLLPS